MFGPPPFNSNTLKSNLKMAQTRITLVTSKKKNLQMVDKRNIAGFLAEGKEEKAQIKVEALIHDDYVLEAYELIDLLCDLVHQRMPLINASKECPLDLKESICSLIWSAKLTSIEELLIVEKQFELKYGKIFADKARANAEGCVNERIVTKLSIRPPDRSLVIAYMQEIAKDAKVTWEPKDISLINPPAWSGKPMAPGDGYKVGYSIPETHVYGPTSGSTFYTPRAPPGPPLTSATSYMSSPMAPHNMATGPTMGFSTPGSGMYSEGAYPPQNMNNTYSLPPSNYGPPVPTYGPPNTYGGPSYSGPPPNNNINSSELSKPKPPSEVNFELPPAPTNLPSTNKPYSPSNPPPSETTNTTTTTTTTTTVDDVPDFDTLAARFASLKNK